MGSNNRIEGTVSEVRNGSALLSGSGWSLWGDSRGAAKSDGAKATAMIRLERVRVADGPGENRVKLPLVTSMYLGDKWEYLFKLGDMRMRAYGREALSAGEQWLEIPRSDLWVF